MAVRNKNKEPQQLNLNPDVRLLLKEQSERAGLSMSSYIERIILEKDWDYKQKLQKGGEN